jgi:hypothetical protein
MREKMISALLAHAQGDIQKHKMNVEVSMKIKYLLLRNILSLKINGSKARTISW